MQHKWGRRINRSKQCFPTGQLLLTGGPIDEAVHYRGCKCDAHKDLTTCAACCRHDQFFLAQRGIGGSAAGTLRLGAEPWAAHAVCVLCRPCACHWRILSRGRPSNRSEIIAQRGVKQGYSLFKKPQGEANTVLVLPNWGASFLRHEVCTDDKCLLAVDQSACAPCTLCTRRF